MCAASAGASCPSRMQGARNSARQREGAGARALSPPGWQRPSRKSERSGRDGRALRTPTGWHFAPPCCNGRWVATVLWDPAFTREARPEGERVIRKRERTLVLSLLCAVRPRRPRSRPRCAGTDVTPYKANTPAALAGAVPYNDLSVSPLARRSTSPQRGGRMGGADGTSGSVQARDPSSLRSSG